MDEFKNKISNFFKTKEGSESITDKAWFKIGVAIFVVCIILLIAYFVLGGSDKISGFLPDKYGERSDLGGDDDDDFSMKSVFAKYKKIQDKFIKRKK